VTPTGNRSTPKASKSATPSWTGSWTFKTPPSKSRSGLDHTLDLSGSTIDGGVTLAGATLGGDLDCVGAAFTNPDGNALFADGMRVSGDVFLSGEFKANGEVRLAGATIGSDLACEGATFTKPNGDALATDQMKVDGILFWRRLVNVEGAVSLPAAQVGVLVDDERSWQFPDMTYQLQGPRVDRFAGIGAAWDAEQRTAGSRGRGRGGGRLRVHRCTSGR
jgi:hypothetical protein